MLSTMELAQPARADLDSAEQPLTLLADEIDVHVVARPVVETDRG
jgi:hypothetical protein